MATINELLIKLEADTTQLRRAFDQVDKKVNDSAKNMQGSVNKIDGSILALTRSFGALIPALSVGAILSFGKAALDSAGGIGELAEQLGVSTDALQAYQFAATQSGVKSEELNVGLSRLTRTVGDAANGNTEAIRSFRDLDVGILDASGNLRATEDILGDVATAIQSIEDPAKRAAAAVDFFGKSGQRLLPLLSGGRAGLDEFVNSARKAGVILDKDLIAAADRASDRIAALTFKLSAFGKIAVAELARLGQLGAEGFLSQDEKSLERIQLELDAATKKADEFRQRVANRQAQGMPAGLDQQELAKWERLVGILQARKDFLSGPPPKAAEQPPGGGTPTNPRTKEETDAIKAATEALEKKVSAQKSEADGQYQSESAKAVARATEETLIALRAKGIQGLNDEQKALLANLGVQVQRIQTQKTEIENVRAYAESLNEYVDNATEAANAEAVLGGQVIKTTQATDEQVRLLNEQAEAATKSTIRWNSLTQSFELYDRELQVVVKTQELLAQNTALSTEEARRQAEVLVDDSEKLKRGTDDVQKRVDNMNDAAQDFSRVIGTAFEDAAVSGGKFSDILKGLEQDIARIIWRMTVTKPLENQLTGLLGGGGSGFGDLFKGLFGSTPSNSGWDTAAQGFGTGNGYGNMDFGGFFADGGRPPVGVPSVVGESGPEVFVPDRAGTIISNDNLRGLGGGVTVNQSFSFGGDMTATARAEAMRLLPAFKAETIQAIEERQRRGKRA
jgi:hypothetical protein